MSDYSKWRRITYVALATKTRAYVKKHGLSSRIFHRATTLSTTFLFNKYIGWSYFWEEEEIAEWWREKDSEKTEVSKRILNAVATGVELACEWANVPPPFDDTFVSALDMPRWKEMFLISLDYDIATKEVHDVKNVSDQTKAWEEAVDDARCSPEWLDRDVETWARVGNENFIINTHR